MAPARISWTHSNSLARALTQTPIRKHERVRIQTPPPQPPTNITHTRMHVPTSVYKTSPCLPTTDRLPCTWSRYELRDLWSAASVLCDHASSMKRKYDDAKQALHEISAKHREPMVRLATQPDRERDQAIRHNKKFLSTMAQWEQHYEKKILCDGAEPEWSMKHHGERLVFFSRTGAGACPVRCSVLRAVPQATTAPCHARVPDSERCTCTHNH